MLVADRQELAACNRSRCDMALTARQERFVEEYLRDLNATQAAIRAGYSPRSAAADGSRLLTNANVAEAVARAKAERAARAGIDADRVLEEIKAIALAHLSDRCG